MDPSLSSIKNWKKSNFPPLPRNFECLIFSDMALLTRKITHNYFTSFYPQLLLLLLNEVKKHAFSLKDGLTTSYPLYVRGLRYHSFVTSIKVVNVKWGEKNRLFFWQKIMFLTRSFHILLTGQMGPSLTCNSVGL